MTIYEIDAQIASLLESSVDEETGEVLVNVEALEALQMERDRKVENLALAYKNLSAEAKAIKAEEDALAKRRKSVENEAERARDYLVYVLGGEKFKSAKVAVSYRSSESVQVDESFIDWAKVYHPDLLRVKADADKTAIKAMLKNGEELPYTALVTNTSIQIK